MTTTNALAVVSIEVPDLANLPDSRAEQLLRVFEPMVELLKGLEDEHNEILTLAASGITPELSQRARRHRLDVKKVRVETEKRRKDLKADLLLEGRVIDGMGNNVKWATSGMEDRMLEIEEHAARVEAARLEQLQRERVEALSPYVDDADERDLAGMDPDVWEVYLAKKRQDHEDALEAARQAEEVRKERERVEALTRDREREVAPVWSFFEVPAMQELGELPEDEYHQLLSAAQAAKAEHDAEQERIRAENERLAREKAAAEAKAERERKKREAEARKKEEERQAELARIEAEREAERKAAEEARRKEAARVEAERKAERERLEAEARAERERLEEEAKAREAAAEAERERERKAAAAERARLEAMVELAPRVILSLNALVQELPRHAIGRHPDVAPLIRDAEAVLEAVREANADHDEAQLALVEG